MAANWDAWLGELALSGVDPRGWDLNRLLAAYEAALRRGAKDEAEWRRTQAQLTAEPKEVREQRLKEARQRPSGGRTAPVRSGMSVSDARALLSAFSADDARYG